MRDRRLTVLVAVGVVALLLGAVLGIRALRSDPAPTRRPAAHPLRTTSLVSAAGGFSVRVPAGMSVRRQRGTVRLTTRDRAAVVSLGRTGRGTLPVASRRLVEGLSHTYARVRVLGRRSERVDGRPALTTYGVVTTSGKVPLHFVLIVVRATPRNFAVTTFARAASDPRTVLPVVDEVSGSFHVLATKP